MTAEIDLDVSLGRLYVSPRLSIVGAEQYPALLREAARHHDEAWLAGEIGSGALLVTHEFRRAKDGATPVRVPKNAPDMLAEGEFNRFYIRGLCARAIDRGSSEVEVYRGKPVSQPRPGSDGMIGTMVPADRLLQDLRASIGVDPALGLPPGPGSGLTVRLSRAPERN